MPFDELRIEQYFFQEPDKCRVVKQAQKLIEDKLIQAQEVPIAERPNFALGHVFEILAVREYLSRNKERKNAQTKIREVVEELYQNIGLITGNSGDSKPDFVSVVMDPEGNFIINEIVEVKTSQEALDHKIDRQPKHTMMSIGNVVRIINEMRQCENINELELYKKYSGKDEKAAKLINSMYEKIQSLTTFKKLTFSKNLKYHVIVPRNVSIKVADQNLSVLFENQTQYAKTEVSQSQFVVDDAKIVIENYCETN